MESKIQELEVAKKIINERNTLAMVRSRFEHMAVHNKRFSIDQLTNNDDPMIWDAATHRKYYDLSKVSLSTFGPDKPFTETAQKFDDQLQIAKDLATHHLRDYLVPFPSIWMDENSDFFFEDNKPGVKVPKEKVRYQVGMHRANAAHWRLELNGRVGQAITALHNQLWSPLLKEGISGIPEDSRRMRQIHRFNNGDFEPHAEDFEILKTLSEADQIRFKDYVPTPVKFPALNHVQLTAFKLDVFVNLLLNAHTQLKAFNDKCAEFYVFEKKMKLYDVEPRKENDPEDSVNPFLKHKVPAQLKTRYSVQFLPIADNFIKPDAIKFLWDLWRSLVTGGRAAKDFVQNMKVITIHYILGAQSLPYKTFAGEMNLVPDPYQPALINVRAQEQPVLNDKPVMRCVFVLLFVLCCYKLYVCQDIPYELMLDVPHLLRQTVKPRDGSLDLVSDPGNFLVRVLVDGQRYWVSLLALTVSGKYDAYFSKLWLSATTKELAFYYERMSSEEQEPGLYYNRVDFREIECVSLIQDLRKKMRNVVDQRTPYEMKQARYALQSVVFEPTFKDNHVDPFIFAKLFKELELNKIPFRVLLFFFYFYSN